MPIPSSQPPTLRSLIDQLRAARVSPTVTNPVVAEVADVAEQAAATRGSQLLDELRTSMQRLGPVRLPGRAVIATEAASVVDDAAKAVQAASRAGVLDELRRAISLLR